MEILLYFPGNSKPNVVREGGKQSKRKKAMINIDIDAKCQQHSYNRAKNYPNYLSKS